MLSDDASVQKLCNILARKYLAPCEHTASADGRRGEGTAGATTALASTRAHTRLAHSGTQRAAVATASSTFYHLQRHRRKHALAARRSAGSRPPDGQPQPEAAVPLQVHAFLWGAGSSLEGTLRGVVSMRLQDGGTGGHATPQTTRPRRSANRRGERGWRGGGREAVWKVRARSVNAHVHQAAGSGGLPQPGRG